MENSYLNTDKCKFESLQKDESRVHSADSAKACSKYRAFLIFLSKQQSIYISTAPFECAVLTIRGLPCIIAAARGHGAPNFQNMQSFCALRGVFQTK